MEVIERMPESEYKAICEAGVELVEGLAALLKRHGLGPEQAFNVFVIAAAGVSVASELTSNDLANGIDHTIHMWQARDVDGAREAVFDPTFLSDGVERAVMGLAAN